MALDFPPTPTLGYIYSYEGRSWQWNGVAWDVYSPVSGDVVTKLNGLTGGVTLAAGSNVTLTPVGNTITIASSGSGGGGGGTYFNFTEGITVAAGPTAGDRWFDTNTGKLFTAITDGASRIWIEFGVGSQGIAGATGSQGNTGATGAIPTDYVSTFNGLTGNVNFVAGTNITITPAGNTLTIASSGGGGVDAAFVIAMSTVL
jgi:hypothetical protein